MSKKVIKIGTRASQLALWQANHVRDLLRRARPDVEVELVEISTEGDRTLDKPLRQIGGKGLFLKELEAALLDGEIDIAAHSLKDVPHSLPDGLTLGACLKRADARDVLILATGDEPAAGMVIGTGSLRRRAQLRQEYPQLEFGDIRGNIDTRIKKLENGDFDGIVLAAAGLERMGWLNIASICFDPETIIPAPGQGTITLEIRTQDSATAELIATLHDDTTGIAATAERAFTRAIGGDCSLPVAAWCSTFGEQLQLLACIADLEQTNVLRASCTGSITDAAALGTAAANEILQNGGAAIVAQYNDRHNSG